MHTLAIIIIFKDACTVKRWYFDVEDGDKVRLYDSESADLSKATAIKLPKSKTQEELCATA